MELTSITIYKSPFFSDYENVIDVYGENQVSNYYSMLDAYLETLPLIRLLPTIPSIAPNDNIQIVARYEDNILAEWQEYNYCTIEGRIEEADVKYYYFIASANIENNVLKPSIKLTLNKDIWVTHYKEICEEPIYQKIVRRHTALVQAIGGTEETETEYTPIWGYESFTNKIVSTTRSIILAKSNGTRAENVDIFWVRYKLNPTIPFYAYDTDTDSYEEVSTKIPRYGQFGYAFFPIMARRGTHQVASITVVDKDGREFSLSTIYGSTVKLPQTEGFIAVDITTHVPFNYASTFDVSNNNIRIQLPSPFVQKSLYWGDYNSTEGTYQFGLGSMIFAEQTSFNIVEFEKEFSISPTQQILTTGDPLMENWENRLEFNFYPYTKYTIRLPNNTLLEIPSNSILAYITIKIIPTDCSVQYAIKVEDTMGREILGYEDTRGFSETTGEIPITIDAYQDFLMNASRKYNVQYQYSLDSKQLSANYQQEMAMLKGSTSGADAVVQTLKGDLSGAGKALGSSKAALKEYNHSKEVYELDTKYIQDVRSAEMETLKNVIKNTPSTTSDLGDMQFQDRFIVYKDVFIPYEELKLDAAEFKYKGVYSPSYRYPTDNVRKYYDYVRTEDCDFYNIKNPQHRAIINAIFDGGVRKWHLPYVPTFLNKNVNNDPI